MYVIHKESTPIPPTYPQAQCLTRLPVESPSQPSSSLRVRHSVEEVPVKPCQASPHIKVPPSHTPAMAVRWFPSHLIPLLYLSHVGGWVPEVTGHVVLTALRHKSPPPATRFRFSSTFLFWLLRVRCRSQVRYLSCEPHLQLL